MRAQPQRFDGGRQAGIGGHQDDNRIRVGILDAPDQFDAVQTGRHPNVGQHHVEGFAADHVEGILAAGSFAHAVADAL